MESLSALKAESKPKLYSLPLISGRCYFQRLYLNRFFILAVKLGFCVFDFFFLPFHFLHNSPTTTFPSGSHQLQTTTLELLLLLLMCCSAGTTWQTLSGNCVFRASFFIKTNLSCDEIENWIASTRAKKCFRHQALWCRQICAGIINDSCFAVWLWFASRKFIHPHLLAQERYHTTTKTDWVNKKVNHAFVNSKDQTLHIYWSCYRIQIPSEIKHRFAQWTSVSFSDSRHMPQSTVSKMLLRRKTSCFRDFSSVEYVSASIATLGSTENDDLIAKCIDFALVTEFKARNCNKRKLIRLFPVQSCAEIGSITLTGLL